MRPGQNYSLCAFLLVIALNLSLHEQCQAAADTYDLRSVKGIQAFQGPAAARELLAKNGFVVTDPAFKQIFEPYIKSPETEGWSPNNPRRSSLPSFITTDSAWH